ncbi:unnamed protein product, partial [Prorocentrum cordatum]
AAGRSGPRKATVKQGGTFDDYEDPLRWGFVGDGTEHRANLTTPVVHENPQCVVKAIAMHRPTHEPWREETGDYPFAWHLAGRKRTFEIRLQMRLTAPPPPPCAPARTSEARAAPTRRRSPCGRCRPSAASGPPIDRYRRAPRGLQAAVVPGGSGPKNQLSSHFCRP